MKKNYPLLILLALAMFAGKNMRAQTVVTLQPDSITGKDALIQMRNGDVLIADQNAGGSESFEAVAWTWNTDPGLERGLLQFDLSSIPGNAIIQDAKLSLYNNPTSTACNGEHSSLSGPNNAMLLEITSAWDEYTVTWNNQPSTSATYAVSLAQSTSIHEDYLDIDVHNLVADMIANPTTTFGFMIKLDSEAFYRSMIFGSSDNPNQALHPKLVVTYGLEGINEITDNSLIDIYPTPSAGDFFVRQNSSVKGFTSLYVENVLGEKILAEAIDGASINGLEIDLSDQAKGIYLASFTGNQKRCIKKLVVE